ncbi:MAG: hypothetical protein OEU91_08740 [Gammaproteobacteria bacterium]|nr:hypothetical protein [Gammaproteobacteria bacterium]
MAAGKINLQCDTAVRDILCTAIRDYAHAAYPAGGSDCAQVARYTLLDLAREIEEGIREDGGSVLISRRPRAMIKAALEYYFDRLDQAQQDTSTHRRKLMAGLLKEQAVSRVELDAAQAADAAA